LRVVSTRASCCARVSMRRGLRRAIRQLDHEAIRVLTPRTCCVALRLPRLPQASVSDRHLARAAEADEAGPVGVWHAAWRTLGLDALASQLPVPKAASGDRATARCRAGRSLAAAPGYASEMLERHPCSSRQPPPLHPSDRASVDQGRLSRGLGGVNRVEHDGWEKAAAASIWSALVSEGFHLMKSANKMLLSLSDIDEAASEHAEEEGRARRDAIAALLVALARFETVRRLFGGRCYNSDLARNTGLLPSAGILCSPVPPCRRAT
jgi:hypothetical protein